MSIAESWDEALHRAGVSRKSDDNLIVRPTSRHLDMCIPFRELNDEEQTARIQKVNVKLMAGRERDIAASWDAAFAKAGAEKKVLPERETHHGSR